MANAFIRAVGGLALGVAGLFLVLFLSNVRSRIYYHGPNWSFLFWPFLYCVITGIGLLRLRKWGVISLFLPGIADAVMLISYHKMLTHGFPAPWVLFNIAFCVFLIAIPAVLLQGWKQLRWNL